MKYMGHTMLRALSAAARKRAIRQTPHPNQQFALQLTFLTADLAMFLNWSLLTLLSLVRLSQPLALG
jgi:hypothetical protein